MSFEGIDEWDENFLEEALRVEFEAISSRNTSSTLNPSLNPSHHPHLPPPPPSVEPNSSNRHLPQAEPEAFSSRDLWVGSQPEAEEAFPPIPSSGFDSTTYPDAGSGFSPPRELSQRFTEKPSSSRLEADCEIAEPSSLRNGAYGGRAGFGGGGGIWKDKEVDRLKRELGRVSKQLGHLEHEHMELKKERAKKDEQLRSAFSQIEAKDAEIHCLKKATMEAPKQNLQSSMQAQNTGVFTGQTGDFRINDDKNFPFALERAASRSYGESKVANGPSGKLSVDPRASEHSGPERMDVQADEPSAVSELKCRTLIDTGLTNSRGTFQESSFHQKAARLKRDKTVGIQTDSVQDCGHISLKDVSMEHISNKLLAIWGSLDKGRMGRSLISKLLVSCSADFCVLFRCMNLSSNMHPDSWADHGLRDMVSHEGPQPITSIDVAKVSRLYAMLMKVHNDMERLNALLEALLELCTLENVFVVHRSLRILHTLLQHLSSCNIQSDIRNNVLVDQSLNNFQGERRIECKSQIMDFHNSEKACGGSETSDLFLTDLRSFDLEDLCKGRDGSSSIYSTCPSPCWVSIFEVMQKIALKNKKEYIQIESMSIMILILMRSGPTTDREKFGMPVLECVSQLLRKESGLPVQKQAVRLLFLLLNCPKILMMFCTGGKDGAEHAGAADGHNNALQRSINLILEGLSECLACGGTGTLGLQLRRQVIMLLAFIASYGKSGFEVLINSTRTREFNFLELIIRVLASELDAEIADLADAQALSKDRILLVREALILLNRFASHASYSRTALQAVTSSNSTARLTIEIANRLPQKDSSCWRHASTKKTQMEAEITDLARLFRAKVFGFLGEKHSAD